ncbi:hypothetical protein [Botrimarina sp.]|uniref:hypothetical protein n=1 Tax=Botrimarina sp. TaxID=2795802 RepID=UPI0032EC081A
MLIRWLLWVDCLGAALAGVLVVALAEWLGRLEGLPPRVLLLTGAANLLYGSYSFSLAVRTRRPLRGVERLAIANMAWPAVCVALLTAYAETATPFAYAHLGGEAVYVAGLGLLEWTYRHRLAAVDQPHAAPA